MENVESGLASTVRNGLSTIGWNASPPTRACSWSIFRRRSANSWKVLGGVLPSFEASALASSWTELLSSGTSALATCA